MPENARPIPVAFAPCDMIWKPEGYAGALIRKIAAAAAARTTRGSVAR
jgi:hypothetical protein